MMNLLGLGPLKKSQSSPNTKGDSPTLSPVRKFFSGNGSAAKDKDKDSIGKEATTTVTTPVVELPPLEAVGVVGNNGKKGSKNESSALLTAGSSTTTKIKLLKTTSIGGGGGGGDDQTSSKVKATTSSVIVPSSFGANGTAAAVVAGVIAGEDPSKKELEVLKERANEVANESLMSTRRMAEFCENAKDAGIKIIVALDDQKEQLDRIQDSLTEIRVDLINAEKNLRGMDKCCGIFNNPFKKITEDEVEEEMEKNMDLVSSMLGNLRNMAIDMNTEIESQNKQMNIINDMTEQNNARIDDAIQKTHDLKRQ